MDEVLLFIVGLLLGIVLGGIFVCLSFEDYSKINKNADGWYATVDQKIYRLVEVQSK